MPDRVVSLAVTSLLISLIALSSVFLTFSQISKDIASIRDSISGLEKTVEKTPTTDVIDRLSSEIEELKKSLEKTPTADDIANIIERFTRLKKEVNSISASINALKNEVGETSQSITSLVEQLNSLNEELNYVRDRIESLESKFRFPVTIIDGTGDEVIIPRKPESIVSLAPSVTETLYYVGAFDKIVAVDSFSNYPPEIVELRESGKVLDIGGVYDTNLEAIIGLNPDLVVGVATSPHTRYKDVLQAYGIPVLLLPEENVNDIKRSIIMVGVATGNLDRAIEVALEFDSMISRIKEAASSVDSVKVAWIVWVEPIFIAGNKTFQGDLLYIVGGVNAFENISGWQSISSEALLEVNPDIIILTAYGVDPESFINYLKNQIGDSAYDINAVSNNLVFCINGTYSDILSRPSPRITEGLKLLLYILHPQIYGFDYNVIPKCISPETVPEIPEPPLPLEVAR
ncbi:MAG: helical backbone metal receptor [Desulfurococcales archaeon]|nr:helical backbone metal receptor [Desulfurococcales archaeon]